MTTLTRSAQLVDARQLRLPEIRYRSYSHTTVMPKQADGRPCLPITSSSISPCSLPVVLQQREASKVGDLVTSWSATVPRSQGIAPSPYSAFTRQITLHHRGLQYYWVRDYGSSSFSSISSAYSRCPDKETNKRRRSKTSTTQPLLGEHLMPRRSVKH